MKPLSRLSAIAALIALVGALCGVALRSAWASPTPPTEAQCFAAGRRCFAPQAIVSAYNVAPLWAQGVVGQGVTVAVVLPFGSDTIAQDLHTFDQAFGLQPMCGESGVACAPGMPTFSTLHFGEPSTLRRETSLTGTGGETATSWALETSLVVEVVHAVAPGANILLVTTSTPLTRGGFADLMDAEQNVIDNGLAQVILQAFGASEQFFNPNELQSLRHAFISARQHGVTVLAPSGDGGALGTTSELSVEWPASDPLVLGVGGTYLCTDPSATATEFRIIIGAAPPARCQANPGHAEVGWTLSGGGFSQLFPRPTYQNTLPAGSSAIGAMRGVPDVSSQASALTGALVFDSLDGNGGLACGAQPCSSGWYVAGGTALATSEWAALVAMAVQFNGRHGLGLINPALYKLASDPTTYAKDFFDVSVGTNSVNSVTGYPAATGWDPITGLGTPDAANLVPDLVAASH